MKKFPFMILAGLAALLLSNCTSGNLKVVDDSGRPLDGVILEPVALTYGCRCDHYTGPCGCASVTRPQRVNLRRTGYHSILGVPLDATRTTYVQMEATGLGGSDKPRYWTGSYWK